MRKGISTAIDFTMKWVLVLIVLLILATLVLFIRDRSIVMVLNTLQVPTG